MKQISILVAVLVSAAACNRPAQDALVCAATPPVAERAALIRYQAAMARARLSPADRLAAGRTFADGCLQRWAYRLRESEADVGLVQSAVLGACDTELQGLAAQTGRVDLAGAAQPFDPDAWAKRRTVFYIVQSRVGGCRGPQ